MVEVPAPVEAEPAHVALDGLDEKLLLLRRVGVVEAQMTAPAELLGDAEVQADRLGVADMQEAVGLRREAGDHLLAAPGLQVAAHRLTDEVAGPLLACRVCL
jgi:hypothetical protein